MIEHGYADAAGRRLGSTEYYELEAAADRAGANLNQFLHGRGIQQFTVYHPADRFWTFQLIEAALFVAVAAVLIGVVGWRGAGPAGSMPTPATTRGLVCRPVWWWGGGGGGGFACGGGE